MNNNAEYLAKLEQMIKDQLLPVYDKYYRLIGEQAPPLLVPVKRKEKIPALLQKRTGVSAATSDRVKARKN